MVGPRRLQECLANLLHDAIKSSSVDSSLTVGARRCWSRSPAHSPASFTGEDSGGSSGIDDLPYSVRAGASRLRSAVADLLLSGPFGSSTDSVVGSTSRLISTAPPNITRDNDAAPPFLLFTVVFHGIGYTYAAGDGRRFTVEAATNPLDGHSGAQQLQHQQRLPHDLHGINLLATRRIVELHGGTVGVSTTPGGETAIFMNIPLRVPADVSSSSAGGSPMPSTGSCSPDDGGRSPAVTVRGAGMRSRASRRLQPASAAGVPLSHSTGGTGIYSASTSSTAPADNVSAPHGTLSVSSDTPSLAPSTADTEAIILSLSSPYDYSSSSGGGGDSDSAAIPSSPLPPPLRIRTPRGTELRIFADRGGGRLYAASSAARPAAPLSTSIEPSTASQPHLLPLPPSRRADALPPDGASFAPRSPSNTSAAPLDRPAEPLTSAMVIDDVASNRLLLARLLQRRGVTTVLVLDGGGAAIASWRQMDGPARGTLQLVLCDKEMPGDVDGHDTVATLRAEGFSGVIIGVTGNALEGDREDFLSAGADEVVFKPIRVELLAHALARMGLRLSQ